MKIMILSSKYFYDKIPEIKNFLEKRGHKLKMPNSYDNPFQELKLKKLDKKEHIKWKGEMMRKDEENILPQDAVLVLNIKNQRFLWLKDLYKSLNFEKKGISNYIGGATFLEVYTAWKANKKIFFYNPLPKCSFTDELIGINPTIINGNLNLIK